MRRVLYYFLAANVVGAFFLWLAFRDLPFSDINEWITRQQGFTVLWAAVAYLVIYGACHFARVWRWSYLVEAVDEGVNRRMVHRASALGMTAIFLLPLRLGELVRPYFLSRKSSLGMSSLVGTAVVERVLDGLLMTGMLFAGIFFYVGGKDTAFAYSAGIVAAVIFVPVMLLCLLGLWRPRWLTSMIEFIGFGISDRLTSKMVGLLEQFIEGFEALRRRHYLSQFFGMTLVYWGLNIVSMWFLAVIGFGLDIGLADMFVVMPILIVGIMIPAGPAMAGNFEYFLGKGMALFLPVAASDIGMEIAAFTALIHILQFIVIVAPGLYVMWTEPQARHLIKLALDAKRRRDE